MSEYNPQYEWFSTLEELIADTPTYTSNGNGFFNQHFGCTLNFHRHGGCIDGVIQSLYEFTTFIDEGWYVKVRINPNTPAIYAGKVGQRQHLYQGVATIPVYGFIREFNGYLTKPIEMNAMAGSEAIEKLANEVYEDPSLAFFPNSVFKYIYEYSDADIGLVNHESAALSSIRAEIASVATLAGDCFYGFFPGRDWPEFEYSSIATDFVVLQGLPPRKRSISISDGFLSDHSINADNIVNSVFLYGESSKEVWVAEDQDSISRYGLRRRFFRKRGLTDSFMGNRLARGLLALSKDPLESWTLQIPHTNDAGDSWNLVEQGIPFPWVERVVIQDFNRASKITDNPINRTTVTMGTSLSVTLELGTSNLDTSTVFGIIESRDNPYFPYRFRTGDLIPGSWTKKPDDITEPPVGVLLGQKTGAGVSYPQISQSAFSYNTQEANNQGATACDFTLTSTASTGYVCWDIANRWMSGAANATPEYYNPDSTETIRLVTHYDGTNKRANWNRLTIGGSQSPVCFIPAPSAYASLARQFGWRPNSNHMEYLIEEMIGYVEKKATGNASTVIDASNPAVDVVLQLLSSGTQEWSRAIFQTVPWWLIMHFAGNTASGIPGRSAGVGNYSHLMTTYSGGTNIYSVPVERFPYTVSHTGGFSGYLPADFSSRAVYFTEAGAELAESLGYFWEEIVIMTPSSPSIGDFGTFKNSNMSACRYQHPYDPHGHIIMGTNLYLNNKNEPFARTWYPFDEVTSRSFTGILQLGGQTSGLGIRLVRKKRPVTTVTRITDEAHRDPLPSETSVSQSYGLPRYRRWEYRVRGYDDDYATEYVTV